MQLWWNALGSVGLCAGGCCVCLNKNNQKGVASPRRQVGTLSAFVNTKHTVATTGSDLPMGQVDSVFLIEKCTYQASGPLPLWHGSGLTLEQVE